MEAYIGIIGGRIASPEQKATAREMGRLLAREGWILVCGGMSGIMEEACRGAREEGGITLGILPGTSREEGNPYLSYSIVTGLQENRNSIVVKSCHGLFAIGGSYGTLSEIAFAHLHSIPVIGLDSWQMTSPGDRDAPLFSYVTANPAEGIKEMKKILTSRHRQFPW